MKKILLSVLSVALCLCLIVPIGVTAFAKNEEAPIVAESSVTLEEYLADAAAKGNRVQVVNTTHLTKSAMPLAHLLQRVPRRFS